MEAEQQAARASVNFNALVMSMASAALVAMGLAPHPHTKKTEKNLDTARMNIDLLNMLKQKTQNNLTDEEQKFLDSVLHDVRLKYMQASL